MRVGSSIARRVDVRVIAATNKELEAEVRNNRFRQDLFFRLRSINMRIPPLRERREDIPLLFDHFAREFSARNGMTYVGIDQDAMNTLQNYHWPGNVRELRNVVESMLVMSNNKRIADSDVRRYLRGYQLGEDRNLPVIIPKMTEFAERELIYRALVDLKGDILELKSIVANALSNNGSSLHRTSGTDSDRRGTPVIPVQQTGLENMSLEEIERKMIIDSLQRYNGSRRMAAQALKISERTLYRKIKEYGLQ
jgi:DNA-binding NtrC family response regulator